MSYILLISPERLTQRLGHRLVQNKDLVRLNGIKLFRMIVRGLTVSLEQPVTACVRGEGPSFPALSPMDASRHSGV